MCEGGNRKSDECIISNSGTYAHLTHNGAASNSLIMGGIVGVGVNSFVENCMSSTLIESDQKRKVVGAVAGSLKGSKVINVYWKKLENTSSPCGSKGEKTFIDAMSKEPIVDIYEARKELTSYRDSHFRGFFSRSSEGRDSYGWVFIHTEGGSIAGIPMGTLIVLDELVPVPKKEGFLFDNWYTNGCDNDVLKQLHFKAICYSFRAKYKPIASSEN